MMYGLWESNPHYVSWLLSCIIVIRNPIFVKFVNKLLIKTIAKNSKKLSVLCS